MAIGESWHIKSRAHQCAVTGKSFADGETIIAAIFPDPESSGWLRRDYSLEGWSQRVTENEEKFSHWKTLYQAPVAQEKVEVSKESPLDLLRRLVDEDEEHTDKVRFILAVMLERQKILVEKDAQTVPSGILRVYEHRKEGDVFLIRDPNVALDQVEEVQQEVIALLENQARAAEESLVEPIEESTPRGELEEPQVSSEEALEESTQADGPLG
ncbi:MAG: hypothetical protein RLZZ224_147 [Verrucomicrobiota bacterium]|jgi:hypothetical protein